MQYGMKSLEQVTGKTHQPEHKQIGFEDTAGCQNPSLETGRTYIKCDPLDIPVSLPTDPIRNIEKYTQALRA